MPYFQAQPRPQELTSLGSSSAGHIPLLWAGTTANGAAFPCPPLVFLHPSGRWQHTNASFKMQKLF